VNRPFQCPRCPRSFGTEQGLRTHTNQVHISERQRARRDAYRQRERECAASCDDTPQWQIELEAGRIR
jgi:uncharacterized C2H2 Zn-finger protein